MLYVLDEPSIGLHQRDNDKLIATMKRLRDLGNTLIVVEHDEDTMRQADYIVDVGPGAGVHGGEIVAAGSVAISAKSSAALPALIWQAANSSRSPKRGAKAMGNSCGWSKPMRTICRTSRWISRWANDLCDRRVRFGKSTLVNEILYKTLAAAMNGARSRRANARKCRAWNGSTRSWHRSVAHRAHAALQPGNVHRRVQRHPGLFASTQDAKMRGYGPAGSASM